MITFMLIINLIIALLLALVMVGNATPLSTGLMGTAALAGANVCALVLAGVL